MLKISTAHIVACMLVPWNGRLHTNYVAAVAIHTSQSVAANYVDVELAQLGSAMDMFPLPVIDCAQYCFSHLSHKSASVLNSEVSTRIFQC